MQLLNAEEKRLARAISRLSYGNPFLPERIEGEREALGDAFDDTDAEWNRRFPLRTRHPNVVLLRERAGALVEKLGGRKPGKAGSAEDRKLCRDLILFQLFHDYSERFDQTITEALDGGKEGERIGFFVSFRKDCEGLREKMGLKQEDLPGIEHLFSAFFQIRRAFHHIYRSLVGRSRPMARLRGAIWQSIFTHDMRRYERSLYRRMDDFATLVTGPSGTGKELVARAIGLSRYLAFEPKRGRFEQEFVGSFYPLNLSALSPQLIESELFGHCRGAFTGAVQDRAGWLEVCPDGGTVFLDEIGEVAPSIQVKLLRVLQDRTFQRMGESEPRRFRGKLIAATHRDLPEEIRAGRFRNDFFYRLCSDQVTTPSLREQLADSPDELATLAGFVSERLIPGDREAAAFTEEACAWIQRHLGPEYPWPGNFRELEQCLRNLLVRRTYLPPESSQGGSDGWLDRARRHELTADELLHHYCSDIYSQTGNLEEAARRLNLDRRTVKAKVKS